MIAIGAGYVYPPSGVNVGRLVEKVLRRMEWSDKHAALEMQWDEAAFSRGLHGLGPLDVHRLALLPPSFWWKFTRAMLCAILRREEARHEERQSA